MKLIQIYQCLCDETRLRILHLLSDRVLCVCHLQEILQEPQVKISKHLGYLRERGMVEAHRHRNWMIYQLPARRTLELETNLKCLQDCASTDPIFARDRRALQKLKLNENWISDFQSGETQCCPFPKTTSKPIHQK